MLKLLIQMLIATGVFLALSVLHADENPLPGASIIGLQMMQGDDLSWSEPGFVSSDWPISERRGEAGFNHILLPDGIAWLRTEPFALPASFAEYPYALYVITGASFEVYWNGVLIGENGQPASSMATEIDGVVDTRFYIPPDLIHETGNVIAIRYSAQGYARLHLPLAISLNIGPFQDERYQRLAGHVPALLLLGAVGAASLFFGTLFFRRRFDKGSLWLALMFAMVTFQSTAEISRALFSFSYLGIVIRMCLVLVFAYGSGLFLNFFLLTYLQLTKYRRWLLWFTHTAAFIAIMFYYSHFDKLSYALIAIFVFSALLLAALGVQAKRRGAIPLLLVLSVFCLSLLVGYTMFLDSYYYASMALLAATLFVLQANAIREAERLSAEEKLKSNRLELELLKRQIQPHFMMNTLTALTEWIRTDPESSVDMIHALADEFRILNEYSDRKLVPLESELELCRSHLTIMSYRQDQTFELNTDLQDKGLSVPPAIFHTLIENALTHSLYTNDNTTFIFEQWRTETGDVVFKLSTPVGKKRQRGEVHQMGGGMGLSYIRTRLREAWGDAFRIDNGEDENGRWFTRILIEAKAGI